MSEASDHPVGTPDSVRFAHENMPGSDEQESPIGEPVFHFYTPPPSAPSNDDGAGPSTRRTTRSKSKLKQTEPPPPPRTVGRPRTKPVKEKKPIGRPPNRPPPYFPNPDVFSRHGKIIVPGTRSTLGIRAGTVGTDSEPEDDEGPDDIPAAASTPAQPRPSPGTAQQSKYLLPEETEVECGGFDDGSDSGSDSEDEYSAMFNDGAGMGEEDDYEDNSDDDDDLEEGDNGDDDENEANRTDQTSRRRRRRFLRPMPSWLAEPFKQHLADSRKRNAQGLPPLYAVQKSFFFPKPSTYFLLRVGVTPEKLMHPHFALWDPMALCDIPCPVCETKMTRHSEIPRPRRVVDLSTTFWLIGYRYRCRESTCKNPKTGKFGTVTFRSWNPAILERLPRHLAMEFPATLTHRTGIATPLLSLIRSCISSGMGHIQISDALREQHLLAYNGLKLQYMEFLKQRKGLSEWTRQRFRFFLPFDDRSQDGPHGYVPSGQWIRDLYDDFIEQHCTFFEQHMGMLPLDIGALDHSFKLPKHIAKINGQRVFLALHMLTNFVGNIRAAHFVATKAHQAFEAGLIKIRESLRRYGHRALGLIFTDSMLDKPFLEMVFPSLREGVSPVEKHSQLEEFILPDDVTVTTHNTAAAIDSVLLPILDAIPEGDSDECVVVGFDAEWNVSVSDHGQVERGNVAVVQVAYENRVYILQISDMISKHRIPARLAMFLESPKILKAGRQVTSDLRQLQTGFQHPRAFAGALDMAMFAKARLVVNNGKCSLGDLCATILGKRLNKNVSERMSTAWDRRKLTEEQCRYAACDAYVPLLLYRRLSVLTVPQMLVDPLRPGTPVVIYNNNTTVVARGELASPPQPSDFTGITLTKAQILVKILKVDIPASLISTHGDPSRPLSSFGDPPFYLICPRSRVRSYTPVSTNILDDSLQTANDKPGSAKAGSSAGEGPSETDGDGAGNLMQESNLIPTLDSSSVPASAEIDAESETYGREVMSALASTPWPPAIRSRVLKDIFHVFNMLRLSPRHALRKDFAYTLRDAIFIPDKEDYARLTRYGASLTPSLTFEELRAKRPTWLWKHCRRVVPPPEELYQHVERVFSTYGPLKDATTQQPLFVKHNWDSARKILELIRLGHISDPPGIALYTVIGINKKADNLPVYRCFRGTNFTEGGVHTHLRTHLPTSGASIPHVNACLTDFVLRHNLKVGTFNTTGKKYRGHYSIWIINEIEENLVYLEDMLENTTPLANWVNGNLYEQTEETIGILALPDELRADSRMDKFIANVDRKQRHAYLAERQGTRKAILPVHTPEETELFRTLMMDPKETAFASQDWDAAVPVWNTHANKRDASGIYYKLAEQLSAYFNTWKSRVDAKVTYAMTKEARKPVQEQVRNHAVRALPAPAVPTRELAPSMPSTGLLPLDDEELARVHENPAPRASVSALMDSAPWRTPSAGSRAASFSPPPLPPLDQPVAGPSTEPIAGPSRSATQNIPAPNHEQHGPQMVQLARRRARATLRKEATQPTRRPRTCRKCGSIDCKGKKKVDYCKNPCRDCHRTGDACKGRNPGRSATMTCDEAWKEKIRNDKD